MASVKSSGCCWRTRRTRPDRGNLQVVRPHRPERNTRRLPQSPAGAVRRICTSAPATGLDHPLHRRRRPGPAARERTGGAARGSARHRAADQLRGDLLRPAPPRGATRRSAARVPKFHLSTYQGSWAQPQLASQVAVHAVEVGRPAVHAGLSGDSAAFDARGRQLAWCPSGYRGATVVSVPLGSVNTVYQRLGDWVVALAFAILASASVLATLRSSTQTASGGVGAKALQPSPRAPTQRGGHHPAARE